MFKGVQGERLLNIRIAYLFPGTLTKLCLYLSQCISPLWPPFVYVHYSSIAIVRLWPLFVHVQQQHWKSSWFMQYDTCIYISMVYHVICLCPLLYYHGISCHCTVIRPCPSLLAWYIMPLSFVYVHYYIIMAYYATVIRLCQLPLLIFHVYRLIYLFIILIAGRKK